MAKSEQGLIEELFALQRDTTSNIHVPSGMDTDTLFPGSWNFDNLICFDEFHSHPNNNFFIDDYDPFQQDFNFINCSASFNEFIYSQFAASDDFHAPQPTDSSTNSLDTPPEEFHNHKLEVVEAKAESAGGVPEQPGFCVGSAGLNRKGRGKRVEGQPSKNLMAERRRRKRLNDRLSMLRSIVPKITKMDRTSILGDTIDYMKELLEKIKDLNEQMEAAGTDKSKMADIFKGVRPNELLLRNSPKFEVERRNMDTKIEICCTGKPGLLLSTVATLDALGLEIQQCVISCFSDFNMQASCSEESEQRTFMSSEDIKQALFRNAGYGGRCL